MKAITLYEYGSYRQLIYEEIPSPLIGDYQILVRVHATSVNHLDIKKASGAAKEKMPLVFPWIPGHDFAGIVEKVGKEVTSFSEGDKVYGNCNGGSYAEFLAAEEDKSCKMPDNLSFIEASSVPHVGETAWQALYTHGQLKAGETVLIHGGAGAVGAFAVQFAKYTGAKVLTTAATEDIEFVKSLGADEIVDFKTQDFTQIFNNVDLVLALVSGDIEQKSYSVLKEGGRLVSTVGISHQDLANQKNIQTIAMIIQQSAKDLGKITELINAGKVKTDIGVVYSLSDASVGWEAISGDPSIPREVSHGKIILEVNK